MWFAECLVHHVQTVFFRKSILILPPPFFFRKRQKISMIFIEHMYTIIIIIIKNVWLTTVVTEGKGFGHFPFLFMLFFSIICFSCVKWPPDPFDWGPQGETGVDAGPALLSMVRVSAGWCSFLSPASQTGCKPNYRKGFFAYPNALQCLVFVLARKARCGPSSIVF